MKKMFCVLIVLFVIVALVGCEALEYTSTPVEATVTRTYTRKPAKASRRYYVELEYNGYIDRIRNKDLYKSLKEGETLSVIYVEGKNEKGVIKYRSLDLPTNE